MSSEDLKLKRCHENVYDKMQLDYHDKYWGTPSKNARRLFEFLSLSGMQAGLNWWMVWKKRESFKLAFDDFEISKVANYSEHKILELIHNKSLIRNRTKINSIVNNAQRILLIEDEYVGFDEYLWSFVDNVPKVNSWNQNDIVPAVLEPAEEISQDMKLRGFKFCGPTIIYAYIQSVGLVNDHRIGCFKQGKLDFDLSR
ncbi:MAG: DNA-3-methyladenine glycosylase I [Dehalococcoidia bacterium]|nr:DNA-3-methyladenine glycosylase I [Dehalococcoidia bacterium]MQG15388.1 DNA-3-methyladenine glycosylase I [SAR202 cluster bacterium]|tara:strand:+ start:12935 stop:13531 length:597 start_codon:yes stop_codon:yes gene_type:complete